MLACEKFPVFSLIVVENYVWIEHHMVGKNGIGKNVFDDFPCVMPNQTNWASRSDPGELYSHALPSGATRESLDPC